MTLEKTLARAYKYLHLCWVTLKSQEPEEWGLASMEDHFTHYTEQIAELGEKEVGELETLLKTKPDNGISVLHTTRKAWEQHGRKLKEYEDRILKVFAERNLEYEYSVERLPHVYDAYRWILEYLTKLYPKYFPAYVYNDYIVKELIDKPSDISANKVTALKYHFLDEAGEIDITKWRTNAAFINEISAKYKLSPKQFRKYFYKLIGSHDTRTKNRLELKPKIYDSAIEALKDCHKAQQLAIKEREIILNNS